MRDYWIRRAIKLCGSQKQLARRMGVKPEKVSFLLNRARKISLEDAIKIEMATEGEVSRFHLTEHLDSKVKRKLLEEKPNKMLRISEYGALAIAYEKTLGNRKGVRSDLQLGENFSHVKGRTEELAALYGGFGNYKTYQQSAI